MSTKPNIAVIGAAIGGLALAGLLWLWGTQVTLYELDDVAAAFQSYQATRL